MWQSRDTMEGGEGSRPRRPTRVYLFRLHVVWMSSLQPTPPANGKPSIATLNLKAAILVQKKWEHPQALSPLMMEPGALPGLFSSSKFSPLAEGPDLSEGGGTESAPPPVHPYPHVIPPQLGNRGDRITRLFSPPPRPRRDWMLALYAGCTVRRPAAEKRAASRDVMCRRLVSVTLKSSPTWEILNKHVRLGCVRDSPFDGPIPWCGGVVMSLYSEFFFSCQNSLSLPFCMARSCQTTARFKQLAVDETSEARP